jgi:hypothetical protein
LLIKGEICGEPFIKYNFAVDDTMISPKTTALIAAMSLLGAAAPAAFAQSFSFNNNGAVTATQSNSLTANIAQTSSQYVGDDNTGDVEQESSQGFCLQSAQQNAAAGNIAANIATQDISDVDVEDDSDQNDIDVEVDCS